MPVLASSIILGFQRLFSALLLLCSGCSSETQPIGGGLVADPAAIDFGAVGPGERSHRNVLLRNLGDDPITLQGWTINDDDRGAFSIDLVANVRIGGRGALEIKVTFTGGQPGTEDHARCEIQQADQSVLSIELLGSTSEEPTDAGSPDAISEDSGYDAALNDATVGDVDSGSADAGIDDDANDVDANDVDANDVDAGDLDASPGIDVPPPCRTPVCTSGWCWENPLPHGHTRTGLWGSAHNDIWSVSANGLIEHYDGNEWTVAQSATVAPGGFDGIFGLAADDVWALGETSFHWDGSVWSPDASSVGLRLTRAWGASSSDIWGSAYYGSLYRFNGTTWSQYFHIDAPYHATALFGFSPLDLWVSADMKERFYHFDGFQWTSSATTAPPEFIGALSMWGTSSNDLWAVGHSYIWHHDGQWRLHADIQNISTSMEEVWGTSANDIWAVDWDGKILHWSGATDTPILVDQIWGAMLQTIWGSSPTDIWFGGDRGNLYHWDGTMSPYQCGLNSTSLNSVVMVSPTDTWAVGRSGGASPFIGHSDGTRWERWVVPGQQSLQDIYAIAPDNIYAAGWGSILRWDGVDWSSVPNPYSEVSWSSVWASGPNDIWFGGRSKTGNNGRLVHYDGNNSFVEVSTATLTLTRIREISGFSPNDVWTAGDNGQILRYTNGQWSEVVSGLSGLLSVWAFAPDFVLFTSSTQNEPIVRWDGKNIVPFGPQGAHWGVWGTSRQDVWVVGRDDEILHYDGNGWTAVEGFKDLLLLSVHGTQNEVIVVGSGGQILRKRP